MANSFFFEEQKEQSLVKARIVEKYFWAWAQVILGASKKYNPSDRRIAYIDLFAGVGRYKDGSKSTPLKVLEKALNEAELSENLVSIFNDADTSNVQSLQESIQSIPGIEKLKYKPIIYNHEVGENIVRTFEENKLVPTLFFVDPWGYKGLSLKLINSVVKNWGCDCIFFFNYNRINMGLGNQLVTDHMNSLFGELHADQLRSKLTNMSSSERELTIVEGLCQALKSMGGRYVLPFGFKNERGMRTSHHLIFVSKHVRGYTIMKGIMAGESSSHIQDVPSFEYNPATIEQPFLFELARPLDNLEDMLIDHFAGKIITMKDVFDQHHVDRPFIERNYKSALRNLEAKNRIIVEPPAKNRPIRNGEVTFAGKTKIIFPPRQ
jgi:three-Cys-motif partner protein